MGCAVGFPVPRVVGRAVGDPRRVGVAVGDPVARAVRPTVRVGVGRADAWVDGVGVGGPGVSDGVGRGAADGLGELVLTTAAGFLCPPPATRMSGAPALGSSLPTPGTESGSSPGEETMLTTKSARYADASAPRSQPVQRNQRRRRPVSSTKIGNGCWSRAGSGLSVMTSVCSGPAGGDGDVGDEPHSAAR